MQKSRKTNPFSQQASGYRILAILITVAMILSACNMPVGETKTAPTQAPVQPTATATAEPLPTPAGPVPPTVVETLPLTQGQLNATGGIQLTFDQAMDHNSVEAAMAIDPAISGSFEWKNDYTVQFVPDQPFPQKTDVTVTVGETAQSQSGESLLHPLTYSFQSSGSLRVVDRLPDPLAGAVDPAAQILVTFNRPVAALGDETSAPPALTISPEVSGSGQWINTSTYQFIPEPALAGGVDYTVSVDPTLQAQDGAALEDNGNLSWTFTTAFPQITDIVPPTDAQILLDAKFVITFNQAMDTADVENALQLLDSAGSPLSGSFAWNDKGNEVTFTPAIYLPRGSQVRLSMPAVHARGGTVLDERIDRVYQTVGDFSVNGVTPADNEAFQTYGDFGYITFQMNSPLATGQNLVNLIQVDPRPGSLNISGSFDYGTIYISGVFAPGQQYTVNLSADLRSRYGQALGAQYSKVFVAENSTPSLSMPITWNSGSQLFATTQDKTFTLQATNIRNLDIRRSRLSVAEFLRYFSYENTPVTPAADTSWQQTLELPVNENTSVAINLDPGQVSLPAGLYGYQVDSPQIADTYSSLAFQLAVSSVQLTLKEDVNQLLVWAVGLDDQQPLEGRTITAYENDGTALGAATTDADGIAHFPLPAGRERYRPLIALLGQPGEAEFGAASTQWSSGLSAWEFGYATDSMVANQMLYLYTDRPIYQPGQTVYYRTILKQAQDARYSPAVKSDITLQIFGAYAVETGISPLLDSPTLPVSEYGTSDGSFTIPEDAPAGDYAITYTDGDYWASIGFTVSDYRKPEVDLSASFSADALLAGQDIQAAVRAFYYSGEPAANASVSWTLTELPQTVVMPQGYTVGPLDTSWLEPYAWRSINTMGGGYLLNGTAQIGADGSLPLTFSAADLAARLEDGQIHQLALEVSLTDESGYSVAFSSHTTVYPSETLIGILPVSWMTNAGAAAQFKVLTTDWNMQAKGSQVLRANFDKIEWQPINQNGISAEDRYQEVLTPVSSADFQTNARGEANLEFTPDEPGSYRLRISGSDGGYSDYLLWVGGAGRAAWPALPDQHILIELDQDTYQPGDTARLFIPNPFSGPTLGLVTVERGSILQTQVIRIDESNTILDIPVDALFAPNVYFSVTLLGKDANGRADFRQGYKEATVKADALKLKVSVVSAADTYEPGQNSAWTVTVSDSLGNPVQGQFSFAAVDKAIYALKDPVEQPIEEAFYGQRPLSVSTSTSLANYINRLTNSSPGLGGGGGGGDLAQTITLRSDYRDTAFWNGSFETDASGKAQIEFPMPDNLTTWVITVRGLTRDTKVGEAQAEVQVSKPLTIRPATPRFLVVGDHVQLAAVVHNNTGAEQTVNVQLQAQGVTLDSPELATQTLTLQNGERQRVNWWASVQDQGSASLRFSVQNDDYADASTPPWGDLPIERYTAPQTFATAGVLNGAGETKEVVSLPRSFSVTGGELKVEMTSTLLGALVSSLDALEATPTSMAEPALSRLLANLSAYRLMRDNQLQTPDLESRLVKAIRSDLDWLVQNQLPDGGWGWSAKDGSDLYLNSYALLVFHIAGQAGFQVNADVIDRTQNLVMNNLAGGDETWKKDRLAFAYYALIQTGQAIDVPYQLIEERALLNPWAQALLAIAIKDSDVETMHSILSDLESTAIRSSTGIHWAEQDLTYWNYASPVSTTAMVVYALAELDPASSSLVDAVRYVISNRRANGGWASSFESGWVLAALTRAAVATGDLQGDFEYSATINDTTLASGAAQGVNSINPARAQVSVSQLAASGNILAINRTEGSGRLYYKASLEVGRPVDDAPAISNGFSLERRYYLEGADCTEENCPAITSASVLNGSPVVKAVLTLTVPEDSYYLMVEDYIPAGAEIIDLKLNTMIDTSTGEEPSYYAAEDPLASGWGWWYFSQPQIYRDHLSWNSAFVKAGTYVLTYQLQLTQPGEYRVLPAHAYEYYFPEVQGTSAGQVFTIKEQ
jgi:uncharacterized protein YfaS (alpha-2-macroglobulin family)